MSACNQPGETDSKAKGSCGKPLGRGCHMSSNLRAVMSAGAAQVQLPTSQVGGQDIKGMCSVTQQVMTELGHARLTLRFRAGPSVLCGCRTASPSGKCLLRSRGKFTAKEKQVLTFQLSPVNPAKLKREST